MSAILFSTLKGHLLVDAIIPVLRLNSHTSTALHEPVGLCSRPTLRSLDLRRTITPPASIQLDTRLISPSFDRNPTPIAAQHESRQPALPVLLLFGRPVYDPKVVVAIATPTAIINPLVGAGCGSKLLWVGEVVCRALLWRQYLASRDLV